MITHIIHKHSAKQRVSPSKSTNRPRFEGAHGSDEHKMFIFLRAAANCDFKVNDKVLYRRNPYFISEIYSADYDFNWIEWDGLAPKFVELINVDGEIIYVNPGQLKRSTENRRK